MKYFFPVSKKFYFFFPARVRLSERYQEIRDILFHLLPVPVIESRIYWVEISLTFFFLFLLQSLSRLSSSRYDDKRRKTKQIFQLQFSLCFKIKFYYIFSLKVLSHLCMTQRHYNDHSPNCKELPSGNVNARLLRDSTLASLSRCSQLAPPLFADVHDCCCCSLHSQKLFTRQ